MEWAKSRKLVDDTVAHLKAADGDREGVEAAIRRYLERGHTFVGQKNPHVSLAARLRHSGQFSRFSTATS